MPLLILGLLLFFGAHSVSIVNEPWRDRMHARLGALGWRAIVTLVSIAGIVLIVHGYAQARLDPVVLYTPPTALRHLTLLLMVPVFPLLLATYLPGRIRATLKHPTLVATKLWAFAHLLANGTLADVLLFGAFLAWAVADRISMKHRTQRPLPGPPARKANDAIAVIGGLVLYAAFVMGVHAWLIGVSPI
ncbi:NnrU family protein [Nitrogeniibacter mangrovi]|uniref:NnrU family protein n=1 Tax=Nitrogeniibacter mangrovi TaxID=2016596 RepID=A0A6C1B7H4_9RHOO|nr:NnrU family protein [Nitrogeniibacter mangrovi]QID19313.1 NnrU family protein [Nitrogeniibacter mangrovi]